MKSFRLLVKGETKTIKYILKRFWNYLSDALSTKDRDRDPWLEIFRLPREIWVKELEAIQAQILKQAAADKAAASSQRPPLSPSAQSQVCEIKDGLEW